jgi:hypothetical protein
MPDMRRFVNHAQGREAGSPGEAPPQHADQIGKTWQAEYEDPAAMLLVNLHGALAV